MSLKFKFLNLRIETNLTLIINIIIKKQFHIVNLNIIVKRIFNLKLNRKIEQSFSTNTKIILVVKIKTFSNLKIFLKIYFFSLIILLITQI